MSSFGRFFRATCTFLVLLGLGTSMVECAVCTDRDGQPSAQVTPAVGNAPTLGDVAKIPAPSTIDCCPCIHTFPTGRATAGSVIAVLIRRDAGFHLTAQLAQSRHPEPLAPPPIA